MSSPAPPSADSSASTAPVPPRRAPIRQVWPASSSTTASTSGSGSDSPGHLASDPLSAAYRVERPRLADRPWVALTMIASIDGATEIDGNSRPLGNKTDSTVLMTMRAVADVIMVGAASAVADHYGPPSKPGQRIGVVTRSIDIDLTTPLFTSGAGFLITTDEAVVPSPADDAPSIDVVRCGPGEIDFAVALTKVSALVGGANLVHLEGGPTLNALMLAAGLIDEINVTTAPMIAGGPSRLIVGFDGNPQRLALAHQLIDDDDYVFSRWLIRR